jgi:hypothetical protein
MICVPSGASPAAQMLGQYRRYTKNSALGRWDAVGRAAVGW